MARARRLALLAFALVAVGLALAGCRVQPLYGTVNPVGPVDSYQATQDLQAIDVLPIPDRLGQQFYNALRNELVPAGLPAAPAYALDVSVSESVGSQVLRTDATATRALIVLTASYRLSLAGEDTELFSDAAQALTAYNIGDAEYAVRRAERDARARAVKELANRMRARIASWFVEARADGTLARKLAIGE
jgi:LPS-assembly lipoprotein